MFLPRFIFQKVCVSLIILFYEMNNARIWNFVNMIISVFIINIMFSRTSIIYILFLYSHILQKKKRKNLMLPATHFRVKKYFNTVRDSKGWVMLIDGDNLA